MPDDIQAMYDRSLQQAALIGLFLQQTRVAIAEHFVEEEICDNALEAAAAINNAAARIIDMDAMRGLLEEDSESLTYDRSEQLRSLFVAFYDDVMQCSDAAADLDDAVTTLQERYDFPEHILEDFIRIVQISLQDQETL